MSNPNSPQACVRSLTAHAEMLCACMRMAGMDELMLDSMGAGAEGGPSAREPSVVGCIVDGGDRAAMRCARDAYCCLGTTGHTHGAACKQRAAWRGAAEQRAAPEPRRRRGRRCAGDRLKWRRGRRRRQPQPQRRHRRRPGRRTGPRARGFRPVQQRERAARRGGGCCRGAWGVRGCHQRRGTGAICGVRAGRGRSGAGGGRGALPDGGGLGGGSARAGARGPRGPPGRVAGAITRSTGVAVAVGEIRHDGALKPARQRSCAELHGPHRPDLTRLAVILGEAGRLLFQP